MVSIIIINYNTFQLTVDCIRSVIEKTTCVYEIILVDNASTERDPQEFKKLFPSINLVVNSVNYGFAKGNNTGIAVATGDYILLLNSDTLLINDAIDKAYNKIKSDDSIGALTAQLISVDGSLQQASFEFMPLHKLLACSFKLHKISPYFKAEVPDLNTEHFTKGIWGTFFLFPKKILGLFPDKKLTETFFMYAEDAEWSYYLIKEGFNLLYYPEAKVLHYGGGSAVTNERNKWINGVANEYTLVRIMHGKLYTTSYFLIKALFYLSCFDAKLLPDAKHFVILALKNLRDNK